MTESIIKKKLRLAVIAKPSILQLTKNKFTITNRIQWGVVNSLKML